MDQKGIADNKLIADNRRFHYPRTGLLVGEGGRKIEVLTRRWIVREQEQVKDPSVLVIGFIGFFGFFSGPSVHIIDSNALADPLLSKLPALRLRIAHFSRVIPWNYVRSVKTGKKEMIRNKDLATYYEKILLITRGKLFSIKRLIEIWNINTGKYDRLIDSYINSTEKVRLSEISEPKAEGTYWDNANNLTMLTTGVEIDLERKYYSNCIEVSLEHDDRYQIIYFREGLKIGEQTIQPSRGRGLTIHLIEVPQEVREEGYDMIKVVPLGGNGLYSIGHIRLFE
jgi:arabinofuranosyltransferase